MKGISWRCWEETGGACWTELLREIGATCYWFLKETKVIVVVAFVIEGWSSVMDDGEDEEGFQCWYCRESWRWVALESRRREKVVVPAIFFTLWYCLPYYISLCFFSVSVFYIIPFSPHISSIISCTSPLFFCKFSPCLYVFFFILHPQFF